MLIACLLYLSAYVMFIVIEKSSDYFFNTWFISLDPKRYYILLTPCTNYRAKRLVMMSVSLCTQTGLHYLTIPVQKTRVCFIDIWYTSLTSVHYNLMYGLAIVTESFSPLDLDYTTSLVKVQIRSYMTSNTILDSVYLPYTLNWLKLVSASLHQL